MESHYLKLKALRPDDQEAMEIVKRKLNKVDTRYGSETEETSAIYSQMYNAALLTIEHLLDDLEAANETMRLQNIEIARLKGQSG